MPAHEASDRARPSQAMRGVRTLDLDYRPDSDVKNIVRSDCPFPKVLPHYLEGRQAKQEGDTIHPTGDIVLCAHITVLVNSVSRSGVLTESYTSHESDPIS
jgi:hypothetical protein